jgi:uncharacterized protein with ACT and thioredoxin-like domain
MKVMASYHITVNEKMTLGKNIIALLQSIPQAVTFEIPKKKEAKKSWLYYELEGALNDVRLMREGKKKEKTLDELIDELRNSND